VEQAPVRDPGELAAATFTVPDFNLSECPHGEVTTVAGRVEYPDHPFQSGIAVLDTARVDVDGDGASDVVATVSCTHQDSPGPTQVLVFDRTGPALRLIGRAVQTDDLIAGIFDVADGGDGTVRVKVGDRPWPELASAVVQWRVYRWNDRGFTQVGGLTQFPADPPAVALHVSESTEILSPGLGRRRQLTLRLLVQNDGAAAANPLRIALHVPTSLVPVAGDGWTGCLGAGVAPPGFVPESYVHCPAPAIAAHGRWEVTYRFELLEHTGRLMVNALQIPPAVLERDVIDNTVSIDLEG
jgi:hypothetical protein